MAESSVSGPCLMMGAGMGVFTIMLGCLLVGLVNVHAPWYVYVPWLAFWLGLAVACLYLSVVAKRDEP